MKAMADDISFESSSLEVDEDVQTNPSALCNLAAPPDIVREVLEGKDKPNQKLEQEEDTQKSVGNKSGKSSKRPTLSKLNLNQVTKKEFKEQDSSRKASLKNQILTSLRKGLKTDHLNERSSMSPMMLTTSPSRSPAFRLKQFQPLVNKAGVPSTNEIKKNSDGDYQYEGSLFV